MPTHIHPSVLHAPAWEEGEHYDPPSAESGQRIESITELLRRAQIAALIITLDRKTISKEAYLEEEIQKLIASFFPLHFDTGRIERRCRLLGRTLLNNERDEPVYVAEEELDNFIMNQQPSQFGSKLLARIPPELKLTNCERWIDVYSQLYHDQHDDHAIIRSIGRDAAKRKLSLPSEMQHTDADDRRMLAYALRCPDSRVLDELSREDFLPQYDRVVVGAAMQENQQYPTWASQRANVTILYPCFYGLLNVSSRHVKALQLSSTTVDKLVPRTLKTLIHEFFHTDALGAAIDVRVSYDVLCQALKKSWQSANGSSDRFYHCNTFGTNLLLAAMDNRNGSNLAEDNADSWGRFAQIYLAMITYPEFDFLSGVTIKRRPTLLHHCSLLDCLRLDCVGSIRDLPGYDPTNDFSLPQNDGYEWPCTSSMLLEMLLRLTNDHRYARSLKQILKELDVRTENDPPRKMKEPNHEDTNSQSIASKFQQTINQDDASTQRSSKTMELDSLMEFVLRAEWDAGLVGMVTTSPSQVEVSLQETL